MEGNEIFNSRNKESKYTKSDIIKQEKILVAIILVLVFLVVLVIIVRRNIEIAEQKKPSLITISTEKKDAYPKKVEIPIEYKLMPDHIDSTDLTWHSSDEEVAKFNKKNILETVSIGQTVIHAELSGIKSNEIDIYVANFLEDINIENMPKQMFANKSVDLEIELLPADSVNTVLKIESSDEKIISVRDNSLIAQNKGDATITIKDSQNNILKSYEIKVLVESKPKKTQ